MCFSIRLPMASRNSASISCLMMKHDGFEPGALGVEDGVVDDDLAVPPPPGRSASEPAVAAAHTGRHYHKDWFFVAVFSFSCVFGCFIALGPRQSRTICYHCNQYVRFREWLCLHNICTIGFRCAQNALRFVQKSQSASFFVERGPFGPLFLRYSMGLMPMVLRKL